MSALVVVVHDTPRPQGSKRHLGRGIMVEASPHARTWREAVKAAALAQAETIAWTRLEDAVAVRCTFTLARPASHYRSGRNAHLLREGAPAAPAKLPDLDKLLRSTLDALSAAAVWLDDRLVTELVGQKAYPGATVDALEHPGAVIRVCAS